VRLGVHGQGAEEAARTGVVTHDKKLCIGCRYCRWPAFNVPKFEWADHPADRQVRAGRHRMGPGLRQVCPRGAIAYGRVADLTAERTAIEKSGGTSPVYGESEGGGTGAAHRAVPFELPAAAPDQPVPELRDHQHGIYGFIAPAVLYGALAVVVWRNRTKGARGGEEP
jgi:hypothetical protein